MIDTFQITYQVFINLKSESNFNWEPPKKRRVMEKCQRWLMHASPWQPYNAYLTPKKR